MANQSITIKDVAKAARVSITTVSRYLNKHYDSMSIETRERIEKVIQNLNYQPNKMAQGLKGQSRTVAVVVVNLGYPYAVAVIRSISSVLHASGYALLVGESGGEADQEAQLLQSFIAQGVDGIIIQTGGDNNHILERFASEKPVILIDRQFHVSGALNVITDNQEASARLTARLLAQGYQSVVYVSEPPEGLSTRVERLNGYLEACRNADVEPDVRWVERDNPDSVRAFVDSLRESAPKEPFAVYTANGLVMLEVYPKLTQLPYTIPVTMGLATFDEPDWVQVTNPRLTCVRQPTDDIGIAAAGNVLSRVNSPGNPPQDGSSTTDVQVIPSEVLWADSTKL